VAALTRGRELLESAISYAIASAGTATGPLLSSPTPCPGWDLEALLDHLSDSIAALHEVMAAPGASTRASPHAGGDPVTRLRDQAVSLLGACSAAGPAEAAEAAEAAERLVAVGDRQLTASMVAVTGALEITVHGWDIGAACGGPRPVPSGLAVVLLAVAPLLVTPATRAGLFARPVRLSIPACPGDQLVAFLGRQPGPPAASWPGRG
jgi:uncharacterized protein (TIGR03086 family)